MDACRCKYPIPEPFEFKIKDDTSSSLTAECFGLGIDNVHNICELKAKAVCEFLNILDKLECGIQPDLEILLEEISLINIYG